MNYWRDMLILRTVVIVAYSAIIGDARLFTGFAVFLLADLYQWESERHK